MIRAQDEYLVGNYKRAHDLCIKVRDEVDPESAQLYEYLFASYYNWVGPEKVIADALQDSQNEKHLDKLFLYSGRFVRLQSIVSTRDEEVKDTIIEKNEGEDARYMPRGANKIAREVADVHSQTGEENIKEINSELLLTLADRYTKILDGFRKDAIELDEKNKQKIIRCVLIAKSITENIRVDAVFATTVVNELAGGGKHQWIAIKKDGSLKNTEKNFDAIGHFEDAIRLLAFDKNKDEDDIKDELSYEVFNNLSEKYSYIKRAFEDNSLTEDDARLLLTRLLVSFRVATQLFPQSTQFFAIPVRELGSDISILNWYRLSYNKVLIPIKNDKYKHYFDALKFYQFFLTANHESNLPFNWRKEKEALVEKYYKVRSLHSKKLYESIETSGNYLVIDAKKEEVENVVNAYKSWKICFDVYKEQKYLRKCYQEIVGGEHFFWFIFDSRYIRGYSILKKYGIDFSPNAELDFLVKNMEGVSVREAERDILSNYCKKYVEPRVSEIKSITKYDSRPSFQYKLEVFNYIEQIMLLMRRTGSIESVDAFLYKELVEENTFRWFDVLGVELNNIEYRDHIQLDALSKVKELINISPYFALSDVMLKVMDNRLEDIQRDYHYSFHRIQRFNYEVGDILRMIEIIEKLVGYYRISKDVKYLQIPYLELEEGNGKIRWCNYGLYVYSLKPLDYEIGRIRPRTLIRGVSKFKFTKLRHFVRDEYKKVRNPNNQS